MEFLISWICHRGAKTSKNQTGSSVSVTFKIRRKKTLQCKQKQRINKHFINMEIQCHSTNLPIKWVFDLNSAVLQSLRHVPTLCLVLNAFLSFFFILIFFEFIIRMDAKRIEFVLLYVSPSKENSCLFHFVTLQKFTISTAPFFILFPLGGLAQR